MIAAKLVLSQSPAPNSVSSGFISSLLRRLRPPPSWFPVISTFHQKGHLPDRCGLHDGMTLTFKPRLTENSTRVIDAIQARESEGLLRQVLQQFLHPLDKRRELIWILLCKSFINLQGLFKCLPRILW